MHCPDQHYALTEIVYRCKSCGGLLEVRHDMAALKALEPDIVIVNPPPYS